MLESQILDIGTYISLLNGKEIDTFCVHSKNNLSKYLTFDYVFAIHKAFV